MTKRPINAIAIAGIHTGIGKTIATAVLAEAIGADYWKPVQAGLEERDTHTVRCLVTNSTTRIHPEAVLLKEPQSPHAAAMAEGITIDYTKFAWPVTMNTLLVETAGGVLSPMTADKTMADFIAHFRMPAILIAQNYLGSINHTLMSIEVLKSRGIQILGIVINGAPNEASESFIEQYTSLPIIGRVPQFEKLTKDVVNKAAIALKENLLRVVGNYREQA
jgi:dethiobiotin synthetase